MNDLARIGRVPRVNPVVFGLDHPLVDEHTREAANLALLAA